MTKQVKNNTYILILFFALFRGLIYSLSLPPWGLLDEEQHLDYIIKVSETGKPPIVGEDFLDDRIINSILETNRHSKFHWPTPEFTYDENMTLEGYSYEGFQGPLFYYLFSLLYLLVPGDILDQLFVLRIFVVIASIFSVFLAYKISHDLLELGEKFSILVSLLTISLPERAFSNARISNDIMLEIISLLTIYLITYSILRGISWKTSVGLGIVGGLGLITKIAFAGIFIAYLIAFLANIKDENILKKILVSGFFIALISIPYFHRNLNLYGDFTGYRGFISLYENFASIWTPEFNLPSLYYSLFSSFKHFWIIWWNGSIAVSSNFLRILWVILSLLCLISIWGLGKYIYKEKLRKINKTHWVLISYILITLTFLFLSILGYYQGKYPVIQGRFINPALFPILFLLCFGLFKFINLQNLIFIIPLFLLIVDFIYLFGHLLPYHYYFSQFFINGEASPIVWNGWSIALTQFTNNFVGDKPVWVLIRFFLSLACYIFMLQLIIRKFFSSKLKENLWI